MNKSKIVIKENSSLTCKNVSDSDFIALQKEIEKNIKFHHFKAVNKDEIYVSIEKSNLGYIIIKYKGYTTTQSICNICSADIGEELSIKEVIALNMNLLLDNLDDIIFMETNKDVLAE